MHVCFLKSGVDFKLHGRNLKKDEKLLWRPNIAGSGPVYVKFARQMLNLVEKQHILFKKFQQVTTQHSDILAMCCIVISFLCDNMWTSNKHRNTCMSKLPPKQGIVMSATAIAYRSSPVAESITHRMFDIV